MSSSSAASFPNPRVASLTDVLVTFWCQPREVAAFGQALRTTPTEEPRSLGRVLPHVEGVKASIYYLRMGCGGWKLAELVITVRAQRIDAIVEELIDCLPRRRATAYGLATARPSHVLP